MLFCRDHLSKSQTLLREKVVLNSMLACRNIISATWEWEIMSGFSPSLTKVS